MSNRLELWEMPGRGKYLIAGWHQWADAGSISSGLPQYLIDWAKAKRIGAIRPDDFYLFQTPGTHHLLRPLVKLSEGHVESLTEKRNDFFYASVGEEGFFVFIGEEPHCNQHEYARAFFDAVQALGIKRVAALGGVYAPVPYERDRDVSCAYSLPRMKEELGRYAVRFSEYEGGATICMYLAKQAEERGVEFFRLAAMVPAYDLSREAVAVHPLMVGEDYKGWYDLMVRLDRMFGLSLDLSNLRKRGNQLISDWDKVIGDLAQSMPQLEVESYMEKVRADFTERSYVPLSDVWEEGLRDILGEDEEDAEG